MIINIWLIVYLVFGTPEILFNPLNGWGLSLIVVAIFQLKPEKESIFKYRK